MTRPHLCHVFYAFDTGGAQVRAARIMNASDTQARHTVVALNGDFSCRAHLHHPDRINMVSAPQRGQRGLYPVLLAGMLRNLHPDLLLTYGWGGTTAFLPACLAGLGRIIHHKDGFLPDESDRQLRRRLWGRRVLFRIPARVVFPSRTLVQIAQRQWKLPPSKIRYIPNGVECDRFSSAPPDGTRAVRERLGCAAQDIVIGTVGQLRPEKNHERLLRGFASASCGRRVRLLIVGDGPLKDALHRRVASLGLADRTIFTGLVGDPLDMYRAMDLFALSSDTEQMPIALLEAMSRGLPVVSTDVGDVRTMVSPANRPFIIDRAHETEFASALGQLADDAAKRTLLGQENRQQCLRRFQSSQMIDAYLSLYDELLAGNRHV